MDGLLNVVVLHVRENPNIPRILAKRIAGELPCPRSFEELFPRIF
jgi:hypothetical protein